MSFICASMIVGIRVFIFEFDLHVQVYVVLVYWTSLDDIQLQLTPARSNFYSLHQLSSQIGPQTNEYYSNNTID